MSEPIPGGRRRVDRVLGPGFLDDLDSLTLQELRERRHDAEQEDADLSYIRRLLQGRLDIIRAEMRPAGAPPVTTGSSTTSPTCSPTTARAPATARAAS